MSVTIRHCDQRILAIDGRPGQWCFRESNVSQTRDRYVGDTTVNQTRAAARSA